MSLISSIAYTRTDSTTGQLKHQNSPATALDTRLLDFCSRHQPDYSFESTAEAYCDTQPGYVSREDCLSRTVPKLNNWIKFVASEYASDLRKPSELVDCVKQLTLFGLDLQLMRQKTTKPVTLHEAIPSPYKVPRQCWTISEQTPDGCLKFAPCQENSFPDFSSLPLLPEKIAATRAVWYQGGDIKLCRKDLSEIHRIKDPRNFMKIQNRSFFNMLSFGHLSPHRTYGAANCHGTAQQLSGFSLAERQISKISFHSPSIEAKCRKQAQEVLASQSEPSLSTLSINSGGIVINMDHRIPPDSPGEWSCGQASLHVDSCNENKITAHLFIDKMSLPCWSQLLEEQALSYRKTALRQKIYAGCVLTGSDHSVKMIYSSNDVCYFYESAAPYAAPRIRAEPCHSLIYRFEHSWCPNDEKSFTFEPRLDE